MKISPGGGEVEVEQVVYALGWVFPRSGSVLPDYLQS